jgi:hypothetical protein
MANTLRWYDRQWNQLAAIAIGSLSLIGGVYFDGFHYWITDQTANTVQGFVLDAGGFNRVIQWALPAGYSLPTGIVGDGHNLYVASTFTDAGPPVAVTRRVSLFTKQGQLLRDILTGSPTSITQIDLEFNGQNLIWCVDGTATGRQMIHVDPPTGSNVFGTPNLARLPYGLTFDGMHFPAAVIVTGFWYGVIFDVDGKLLTGITLLPSQPYGMTFTRGGVGDQGTPDMYDGDAIVIAYRA